MEGSERPRLEVGDQVVDGGQARVVVRLVELALVEAGEAPEPGRDAGPAVGPHVGGPVYVLLGEAPVGRAGAVGHDADGAPSAPLGGPLVRELRRHRVEAPHLPVLRPYLLALDDPHPGPPTSPFAFEAILRRGRDTNSAAVMKHLGEHALPFTPSQALLRSIAGSNSR